MILETLADGIGAAIDKQSSRIARKLRALGVWLQRVSVPPVGIELRVIDGSEFTGLVLVERNRVVAVFAYRHRPDPRGGTSLGSPPSPPSPPRWSTESRPIEPRSPHEDEPLWDSGDRPYR